MPNLGALKLALHQSQGLTSREDTLSILSKCEPRPVEPDVGNTAVLDMINSEIAQASSSPNHVTSSNKFESNNRNVRTDGETCMNTC